jgi:hypothetical protein
MIPNMHMPKHFTHSITDPDTSNTKEYHHLIQHPKTKDKWTRSFANELGRLPNGVGTQMKSGTQTIHYIAHMQVPSNHTVTYGRIVVLLRPQKSEVECTQLTVGGNLTNYPGNRSTKTAGLMTANLLFNSVVSTLGAKFMGMDLKNFYLYMPLNHFEYMMKMPIYLIPDEIIEQYKLLPLVYNGYIYIEIQKGMYGLLQAGILLANQLLQKCLTVHGYMPTPQTPGLWIVPSCSPLWSTVLSCNTLVSNMPTTSSPHLKSTTSPPATEMAHSTVASPSPGTTKPAPSTSQCLAT